MTVRAKQKSEREEISSPSCGRIFISTESWCIGKMRKNLCEIFEKDTFTIQTVFHIP